MHVDRILESEQFETKRRLPLNTNAYCFCSQKHQHIVRTYEQQHLDSSSNELFHSSRLIPDNHAIVKDLHNNQYCSLYIIPD